MQALLAVYVDREGRSTFPSRNHHNEWERTTCALTRPTSRRNKATTVPSYIQKFRCTWYKVTTVDHTDLRPLLQTSFTLKNITPHLSNIDSNSSSTRHLEREFCDVGFCWLLPTIRLVLATPASKQLHTAIYNAMYLPDCFVSVKHCGAECDIVECGRSTFPEKGPDHSFLRLRGR